jgi:predicted dehydrogenase
MVKLGVVGGRRGRVYREAARALPAVHVEAVCDVDEAELEFWRREAPDVRQFGRLEDLLADDDITAIYLATPAPDHARHAIACLRAGKHVLCEIPALLSLEDAPALVAAVESSGCVYMLAENYCYIPEVRVVRRLCDEERFGDITYAEGHYLHECRTLLWTTDGALTWRGWLQRDYAGHSYPTHSLGPLAQWLGLGAAGRDELATLAAYRTSDASLADYARQRWGHDHPSAAAGFFNHGDRVVTVLTTRRGTVLMLQLDTHSPRPPQKAGFALQGTRGAYVSGRYDGEAGLIWLDSGGSQEDSRAVHAWRPIAAYGSELFHDATVRWPEYLVLVDFISAVEGHGPTAIDVYDAVTWSVVAPLSRRSIKAGGRPVEVPRFRSGN